MELISIHVPKTAGVSFRRLLQRVYGERAVAFDYGDRVLDPAAPHRADPERWQREIRAPFLADLSRRDPPVRVVHGHFAAGKYAGEFPGARRIVWLREPIARLVSHYCYWLELPPGANTLHRHVVENHLSLEAFAALEPLRDSISRTFLRGVDPTTLDFIGLQERFDEDLRRLAQLLNWPEGSLPPSAPIENRTGGSEEMLRLLDPATVSRLRELNAADLALYRQAAHLDRK